MIEFHYEYNPEFAVVSNMLEDVSGGMIGDNWSSIDPVTANALCGGLNGEVEEALLNPGECFLAQTVNEQGTIRVYVV